MTSAGTLRVLRLMTEPDPRDDEGRPLREGRTPEEQLRPADIEYKQCPYSGSRYLVKPMNASALRQASAHWDAILDALAFVRAQYTGARGIYGPDIMDVWRLSQLACSLPWFYLLRGEPPPAYAAALSKITRGTGTLAEHLLREALEEQVVPPPFTAQALLGLAETTGTLISETEVCAAPDRMILRFLEVLVDGQPSATGTSAVAGLHAEQDEVLRFGAHYQALKLMLWIHGLARRFLYADLVATNPDAYTRFPQLRALLAAPCQPPELSVIEPRNVAAVSSAGRVEWFTALAQLVVPLALDGSDRALHDLAHGVAAVMGGGHGVPASFALLDTNLGHVVEVVERGLGGMIEGPVDAATRDCLLGSAARKLFTPDVSVSPAS